MPKWVSRTETAVQPTVEAELAFGHYAPARCWQRSIGGGFHDPAASKGFGEPKEFKQWLDNWTKPAPPPSWSIKASGANTSMVPKTPVMNFSQTSGNFSQTSGNFSMVSEGEDAPTIAFRETAMASTGGWTRMAPKMPTYPHPSGWKHQTSLLSRNPGFVGTLRTR
ncbi:ETFB [Symbiodinium microadriaticum]|nr:ETFB [Symbiodinium sp. KB8]CAE7259338.1 ETFB [Symbiodinium microadriaticum]